MPNKKVVIHIGSYKTATSYIQNFFALNQKEIENQFNLLYPQTGLTKSPTRGLRHYHLIKAIECSDQSLFKTLCNEINNSSFDTAFISAERLSRLSLNQIEYFAQQLKSFDVKIVYVLRRQDRLIESLYAEYVQYHGFKKPPNVFIQKNKRLLAFNQIIRHWGKHFGSQNIQLLCYETCIKNGLIQHFIRQVLGKEINIKDYQEPKNTNPSLGENGTNFMLNANNALRKTDTLRKLGLKKATQPDKPLSIFSRWERFKFIWHYRRDNLRLIRQTGDNSELAPLLSWRLPHSYKSSLNISQALINQIRKEHKAKD